MKITLIVLICIFTFAVYGQDTTYYDHDGNETNSLNSCHHYKVIERNEDDTNQVVERVYFKSGQIQSETNYFPYDKKILHYKKKEWYENGQIRKDIDYDNGNLNGQVLTYWDNGQLKRHDTYENGKLIEGKVWNSDGKETEYYDFHVPPEFPGGVNNLAAYLTKNIDYPAKSKREGIEGRVLLNFIVEKDGSVSNVKVIESVSKELDAEAVRVVRKMPKWKPGMEDGEIVRIGFILPIKFRLNAG
jgi:TonB family protein